MSCKFFCKIFSVIFCLCFFAVALCAENDNVIRVIATGVGESEKAALKDAMKNAVHQAVGVYVLSETTLTDGKLKEKIFTNSDGLVKSYAELSRSGGNGSPYRLKIRATVVKNEIADKIKKNETGKKINKARLFGTLNTHDAIDQAADTYHYLMREFPRNFLVVKRIGDPVIDESKTSQERDTIYLKQQIKVYVDYSKYLSLTRKLTALFSPFAKNKRKTMIKAFLFDKGYYRFGKENTVYFLYRRVNNNVFSKDEFLNCEELTLPRNLIKKTFNNHVRTVGYSYYGWFHPSSFSIEYTLTDWKYNKIFTKDFVLKCDSRSRAGWCESISLANSTAYSYNYILKPLYNGIASRNGIRVFLFPFVNTHSPRYGNEGRLSFVVESFLHFSLSKEDYERVQFANVKLNNFHFNITKRNKYNADEFNGRTDNVSESLPSHIKYFLNDKTVNKLETDEYKTYLSREQAIEKQRSELENIDTKYPLYKIGDYVWFYTSRFGLVSGKLTEVKKTYIRVNSAQVLFTELDDRLRSRFDRSYNSQLRDAATKKIIRKYQPYFTKQ